MVNAIDLGHHNTSDPESSLEAAISQAEAEQSILRDEDTKPSFLGYVILGSIAAAAAAFLFGTAGASWWIVIVAFYFSATVATPLFAHLLRPRD